MSRDYVPIGNDAKPGRPLKTVLIAVVIAFLAGLVAMGWAFKNWNGASFFNRQPAAQKSATLPDPKADPQALAAPAVQAVVDPRTASELTARVRELEDRMARISVSAEAASGNAARAEGLLVAFAARRALDRGVALGYIEGQLRERFGETQPRAVATVLSASREPVTLEQLQTGLSDLGPDLVGGGSQASWWTGFKREMGGLFVIRKAGTPSPVPTERLARAKRRLEGGQVDAALAEVARLPGRDRAENWMAAARRYIEARRALDTIETAAILSPRTVREALPQPVAPAPEAEAQATPPAAAIVPDAQPQPAGPTT